MTSRVAATTPPELARKASPNTKQMRPGHGRKKSESPAKDFQLTSWKRGIVEQAVNVVVAEVATKSEVEQRQMQKTSPRGRHMRGKSPTLIQA